MGRGLHPGSRFGCQRQSPIECTAVLTFGQRKVAEKILIDLAKDIHGAVFGNVLKDAHNVGEQLGLFLRHQLGIYFFGENTVHFGVFTLNGFHRLFHQISLRRRVRCIIEIVVISALRKEKSAFLNGDLLACFLHAGTEALCILFLDLILVLLKQNIRIAKKDQAEDWLSVFVCSQVRTGTQHIRRMPQVIF